MSEEIEYQNGILPNLLSGFYEQVMIEDKNESLRAIFESLREDFEKQRKQGAVDVLDKIIKLVREMPNADDRYNRIIKGAIPKMLDGGSVHRFTLIKELENKIKELEEEK